VRPMDQPDEESTQSSTCPVELVYAVPRRHTPYTRWIVRGAFLVIAVSAIASINFCLEFGPIESVCPQCGAIRLGRFIDFFGLGTTYGWSVTPTAISTCIQASEGRPCAHQWVTANCQHRWMCALYAGRHPWYEVRWLEKIPGFANW